MITPDKDVPTREISSTRTHLVNVGADLCVRPLRPVQRKGGHRGPPLFELRHEIYKFAESSELVRLIPHSTFPASAQRPERGSSPAVIARVQLSGLHPIDAYPFS